MARKIITPGCCCGANILEEEDPVSLLCGGGSCEWANSFDVTGTSFADNVCTTCDERINNVATTVTYQGTTTAGGEGTWDYWKSDSTDIYPGASCTGLDDRIMYVLLRDNGNGQCTLRVQVRRNDIGPNVGTDTSRGYETDHGLTTASSNYCSNPVTGVWAFGGLDCDATSGIYTFNPNP